MSERWRWALVWVLGATWASVARQEPWGMIAAFLYGMCCGWGIMKARS